MTEIKKESIPLKEDDTRIRTVEAYLDLGSASPWFKSRYGNPYMANPSFYTENNYIYDYKEGLNTKPSNAIELSTSVFKGEYFGKSIIKKEANEILIHQLASPYRYVNISRPISLLKKRNVIQEILRYLIQFQQLNYCYNPDYNIELVYEDLVIRIQEQTKLIPNMLYLKHDLIDKAVKGFEDSVGSGILFYSTVSEVVERLDLGEMRSNYVPRVEGMDGRALLLKAIRKQTASNNNNFINDCINSMMDADMFICPDTVKEQLDNTGINQIRGAVSERRQEIGYYNVAKFNVKTYSKYREKYLS